MSLNEERMMILKMLQEGKINSEEAAKLLEALDGGSKQSGTDSSSNRQQRQQANYYDEVARFRERINDWKKDFKKNYDEKDFDRIIDDFSVKAEKFGKNVAATTVGIVDKVVDYVGSVVDTGSFSIFGACSIVEKSYETAALEGMDLYLEGVNGTITIKKHSEDKIIIKSKIRSPQNRTEDVINYSNTGNSVALSLNKVEFLSVSHEVFVPVIKFNKIKLETKNGKIYVEDTLSNQFESITKNATIDLMGVNSDDITIDTKNAKVFVNYIIGKKINVNTKNSIIDIKNIKVEKLSAANANGRINVENVQNIDGSPEITLELKTRNGDIKTNLNDMENRACKIHAHTTNGGINLLIPELMYNNPSSQYGPGKSADAQTANYNNTPQRVNIYAETSNGYIEVVK
jgi:hypothetical protein